MQKPWQFQKPKTALLLLFGKSSRAIYLCADIFFITLKINLYIYSPEKSIIKKYLSIILSFRLDHGRKRDNKYISSAVSLIRYHSQYHRQKYIYLVNNLVNTVIKSGSISNINGWSLQAVKSANSFYLPSITPADLLTTSADVFYPHRKIKKSVFFF